MKKLTLSDFIIFYNKYFSLKSYINRERPGCRQIIGFLCYYEITITEKVKEALSMFVWDFWNLEDCSGLNTNHLSQFCNKYQIQSTI